MFTVKFYAEDGFRQIIRECDEVTILRPKTGNVVAEITMHRKGQESTRLDIGVQDSDEHPYVARFEKAIVENGQGRTTEIVTLGRLG